MTIATFTLAGVAVGCLAILWLNRDKPCELCGREATNRASNTLGGSYYCDQCWNDITPDK